MGRMRMFFCVIFFCGVLFCEHGAVNISAAEENRAGVAAEQSQATRQGTAPHIKQDDFSTTLDRLNASNQERYLGELKDINKNLREQYAALARNYGAYNSNYMRVQSDIKQGQQTPGFVMKNLQDLETGKKKLEAGIRELEKKKATLRDEALAFYGGTLPPELAREWEKEEETYRDEISVIYRKIGWWLGMEYSPLWRNDEKLFWDNIRDYYRQHGREPGTRNQP